MKYVDFETGEVRDLFLRTPYNYDTMQASNESALECKDKSLAVQDAAEDADINTIVRRFGLTGQLPTDVRAPEYGDFTGVTDYQSALNAVLAAEDSFMKLPGDVRERFKNSPQLFLEFCADDANYAEARKLGLLVPEPVKEPPIEVRVIPDAPKA